jgi:hypothetical protein
LLVAFLLVPTLVSQSLWWDEGISLHLASLPWLEIARDRADNIHPPLYFLLLKVWTLLAGSSPFAARYFSVLPIVILPAAVYRFWSKRQDLRTGRAASFVVALSPPFLIYGQEVRAYAFLPLFWMLILDFAWPDSRFEDWLGRTVAIAVLESAFVLFHYTGFIAIAVVDLLLFYESVRSTSRERARTLRRVGWVSTLGALSLLLPWLFQIIKMGFQGFGAQAGLSNALSQPVSSRFVIALLGVFHGTGLPRALSNPALLRPLVLVTVGLIGGVGVLALRSQHCRSFILLIAVWLLPFAVAPLIWSWSPQAHPRYLLPFILPGWLLLGGVVGQSSMERPLRGLLLASTLVLVLLGLHTYFQNPDYARSDVRSVANYLRRHAQSGDVVFLPHTDWSLPQYGLGNAEPVMIPNPSDDERVWEVISAAVTPGHRVYLLDYERGALDPRGQVRTHLVSAGQLRDRIQFHGAFLETYDMRKSIDPLTCDSFGRCLADAPLCLDGVAIGDAPISGGATAIRFCWQGAACDIATSAAMRLYAPSGALVASMDELLIDDQLRPTDLWDEGSTSTYHILPLQVGAPPKPHRLELGVYKTESPDEVMGWSTELGTAPVVLLDSVVPAVEPWVTESLYMPSYVFHEPSVGLISGIRLVGAHIDREALYPGQQFFVRVHWVLDKSISRPLDAQVVLMQDSGVQAQTKVGDGLEGLPQGRPFAEHVSLRVPADAAEGETSVELISAEQRISLGTIKILSGEHSFSAPRVPNEIHASLPGVGHLVGFSRTPEGVIRSGQPLTLTLVWQAGSESHSQDLTVFTHLVGNSGKIIAQHDAKPMNGMRPTSSWLDGEFIADVHILRWLTGYEGSATLRVGMYDAKNGRRYPWADGLDYVIVSDDIRVISVGEE